MKKFIILLVIPIILLSACNNTAQSSTATSTTLKTTTIQTTQPELSPQDFENIKQQFSNIKNISSSADYFGFQFKDVNSTNPDETICTSYT